MVEVVVGARIPMICSSPEIVMEKAAGSPSSMVGWMMKYPSESLSQTTLLSSRARALFTASAWSSALAERGSLWRTATLEDWSMAMSSAREGKRELKRGEVSVGAWRVGVKIVMVREGLRGWVRVIVGEGLVVRV